VKRKKRGKCRPRKPGRKRTGLGGGKKKVSAGEKIKQQTTGRKGKRDNRRKHRKRKTVISTIPASSEERKRGLPILVTPGGGKKGFKFNCAKDTDLDGYLRRKLL